MGQQQLLLIILVTFIVGMATVVAVDTMQRSYENQNFDAIQQDILLAQSVSLGYYDKPRMLGGGGGNYLGITLKDINLPEENDNATYSLDGITADEFQIIAQSVNGYTITATITGETIEWVREDP